MHRLRGKEWAALRTAVLERDGHSCTVAEYDRAVPCSGGPLHVHEIDHFADAYALDNYSTVCAAHHGRWHGLRRAGFANIAASSAARSRRAAPPVRVRADRPARKLRRVELPTSRAAYRRVSGVHDRASAS